MLALSSHRTLNIGSSLFQCYKRQVEFSNNFCALKLNEILGLLFISAT